MIEFDPLIETAIANKDKPSLKAAAMPLFKFKAITPDTVITVLPPVHMEPMQHYAHSDAYITCAHRQCWCKQEKEKKRAIARSFGPRPKWMRGE